MKLSTNCSFKFQTYLRTIIDRFSRPKVPFWTHQYSIYVAIGLFVVFFNSNRLKAYDGTGLTEEGTEELVDYEEQIKVIIYLALAPVTLLFIFVFFFYYRNKRESQIREKELGLLYAKKAMEMKALKAQVNPHFIFNCLGSIQHYIHHHDNELAERYLVKFSRLIRKVLEASEEDFISLKEDLDILKLYVELESMRIHGGIDLEFTIDKGLNENQIYVPPLLLQPIVENAIWHGLSHKKEGAKRIHMDFVRKQNELICKVIDNGLKKNNSSVHKSQSFGLNLVKERIDFHIQPEQAATLELNEIIDPTGSYQGMQVTLIIPFEEE
ncbi:sensor histidine kinase [Reichenbachiella ulvae]|uniref:Histidine kinase n=1 Tax=Reichenbachiella ulvae TaxID=2980104 RepID=A0ABT3CR28_9BACT|nr:histidine kinase [Reichenbachiella ulvae]MCV9385984.1 histidine kinase [Reichenbachiella ulvae]